MTRSAGNCHSCHQEPRSFWSAPRIATSRPVQHRKSAIHGLCIKSEKSDWLRIRIENSTHAHKIRTRFFTSMLNFKVQSYNGVASKLRRDTASDFFLKRVNLTRFGVKEDFPSHLSSFQKLDELSVSSVSCPQRLSVSDMNFAILFGRILTTTNDKGSTN